MLTIDPHPLLDLAWFVTNFPQPLGEIPVPESLSQLLRLDVEAPLKSDDDVREKVRAMLRHGGYKPTGRGKPASEYLLRAAGDGTLTSINLAVDACNVVSLHSGLPISVVDLDRVSDPLRVLIPPSGSSYEFNNAGQTIDLTGLLCLVDASGPCANPVKDSRRTKTSNETRRTLSLVWGTNALPGRTRQVVQWYHSLLCSTGAVVQVMD